MKKKMMVGLCLVCGLSCGVVCAEEIIVELIPSNGVLVATGMEPGTTGTVEWASTLLDGFTNGSPDFEERVVDSNGTIQVVVPMFFRVSGTPKALPSPQGMVAIPAGTNSGTNPLGDGESYETWYPETYSLTVDDFWMGETEVTNDEMIRVMQWAYDHGDIIVSSAGVTNATGNQQKLLNLDSSYCRITWDGSTFGMKSTKGAGYPCVEVTWYGSAAYCNYRSEMEDKELCYDLSDWSSDLTAKGYRLPTSEEWEYAARGGLSGKRFPWGDTITHSQANYYSDSYYSYDVSSTRGDHPDYDGGGYPYTSPGGTFVANGYGLRDMAGSVWEWCNDVSGSTRVLRGGSWDSLADLARCGDVDSNSPDDSYFHNGFRAVCY